MLFYFAVFPPFILISDALSTRVTYSIALVAWFTDSAEAKVKAVVSHNRVRQMRRRLCLRLVALSFLLASILKLRFKINRKNTPRVYSIPAAERRQVMTLD